jgi:hypothetical protein
MPARFQRLRHAEAWASQGDSGLGLDAQRKLVNDYLNGGKLDIKGLTPTCLHPTSRRVIHRDYLMQGLSAPSECRAQALYCRVVADAATDEEVRTLWVSMAQTWTKLAEAMERLQPH